VSRLAPLEPHALAYDKPLFASLDGFALHAARRAGAFHPAGREALLRYVLRPAVAQERLELLRGGTGSELHRPLAIVYIGGFVGALLLRVFIVPVLYEAMAAVFDPPRRQE
jgi:hypothetical protein